MLKKSVIYLPESTCSSKKTEVKMATGNDALMQLKINQWNSLPQGMLRHYFKNRNLLRMSSSVTQGKANVVSVLSLHSIN